jgi:hypothetical protein
MLFKSGEFKLSGIFNIVSIKRPFYQILKIGGAYFDGTENSFKRY